MERDTDRRNRQQSKPGHRTQLGLALGSGAARGWAHIGVIRALSEMGLEPDVVTGSSIGAFVGAAYASDKLDKLEEWVRSLTWKEIINYLDPSLMGGGFIQGEKLFQFARDQVGDSSIESLPRLFGTVATELDTGREVWFREGSLMDGVRASVGLPGLFAPVKISGRWLVDGGLANPVPVSLCRAMGADVVIAVNLNGDIVGRHLRRQTEAPPFSDAVSTDHPLMERLSYQLKASLSERKDILLSHLFGVNHDTPGLFEVLSSSVNIMQDRITRSRMAGDPPEVILSPRLSRLGLMEFDQAATAIAEGHAAVERMRPALEQVLADM